MSDPATAGAAAAAPAAPSASAAALAAPAPGAAAPAGAPAAPAPPADGSAAAAPTGAPAASAPPPLTLPGKEAKPEEWKAYYKAIGAPEDGSIYALPMPEGADPEFAKGAAAKMAELGFLPHQARGIAEWLNTQTTAKIEAQRAAAAAAESTRVANEQKAIQADETALKQEWQANYDANVEVAKRAVRQFLPTGKAAEALTALDSALGHAATMRLMHKLGVGLAEGTARGLDAGGGNGADSSDRAKKMFPSSPN